MLTADFDYPLPEELIAQYPPEERGNSRMLVLDRVTGEHGIGDFSDLPSYLNPGDCMVVNNTRVIRARLYGIKDGRPDGAEIEILLTAKSGREKQWKCLLRPRKRVRPGTRIQLLKPGTGNEKAPFVEVRSLEEDGSCLIAFPTEKDAGSIIAEYGHVPLPPYIKRPDNQLDSQRYQTIYASENGSAAAPTAGLHFNAGIMREIELKGVRKAETTLHVGPGTFKPVDCENIEEHRMHTEEFELSGENAAIINDTRTKGGRILAVGTTSVRALESCAAPDGTLRAMTGNTNIFLRPPYKPRSVDMLLTNFHLPRSTLLMLVCTFAEREKVLKAYENAVKAQLRFFSYGDCMLLK